MRLADRQGLFTGQINSVQTFGVRVLMMLDQQEKAEGWWRDFRARIGAANTSEISRLFPEFFRSSEQDTAEEIDRKAKGEDGERNIDRLDDADIVWSAPASEDEHADIEAFLAEAQSRVHTITATELGGQWL